MPNRKAALRLSLVVSLALSTAPAFADPHTLHPITDLSHRPTVTAADTASAAPSASAATTPTTTATPDAGGSGAADASTASSSGDAGVSDETAEQHARRKAYVDKTAAKIHELVHAGGKHVTDAERTAISAHWRHTMRLFRIRNLAETDGDKGIVARVDALLDKADAHLFAKLKDLDAKAPAPEKRDAPSGEKHDDKKGDGAKHDDKKGDK